MKKRFHFRFNDDCIRKFNVIMSDINNISSTNFVNNVRYLIEVFNEEVTADRDNIVINLSHIYSFDLELNKICTIEVELDTYNTFERNSRSIGIKTEDCLRKLILQVIYKFNLL